jgi:hypothetical protein
VTPVFNSFDDNSTIVGHLYGVVPWKEFFIDELPQATPPVVVVVETSCGHTFSFEIIGEEAFFLAENDAHDTSYDELKVVKPLAEFANDSCVYTLNIYPSLEYEASFTSKNPIYYCVVVLGVFVFTAIAFFTFDYLVQRRQIALVRTATKQNAIVNSL